MTTYYNFVPSRSGPFVFQPILDGLAYNAYIRWNLFGQRWYLQLYDLDNNLIVSCSVVSSPLSVSIQSALWDATNLQALLTVPSHGWPIGEITTLTVSNLGNYNGTYDMVAKSKNTLSYIINSDPGIATQEGLISPDLNLVKAYFNTSSIVYRGDNSQFEVSP